MLSQAVSHELASMPFCSITFTSVHSIIPYSSMLFITIEKKKSSSRDLTGSLISKNSTEFTAVLKE